MAVIDGLLFDCILNKINSYHLFSLVLSFYLSQIKINWNQIDCWSLILDFYKVLNYFVGVKMGSTSTGETHFGSDDSLESSVRVSHDSVRAITIPWPWEQVTWMTSRRFNVINYTCASPVVASNIVCSEKGLFHWSSEQKQGFKNTSLF